MCNITRSRGCVIVTRSRGCVREEDKGHGEIGSTMHHPTERTSLTVAEEDELIKRVC